MRQWTIDAFASGPFLGNSACVLEPLDRWPSDDWMLRVAAENCAGATAYLLRGDDPRRFGLRWFTPSTEVPLCGHATLAAAHALFAEQAFGSREIQFETASGLLTARQSPDGGYELGFPRSKIQRIDVPVGLPEALGAEPSEVWSGAYLVAIFKDPEVITRLSPRLSELRRISLALGGQGNLGVAALAPAEATYQVIDRFFAPGYGFREDAATGSFHVLLTPIFADRLPAGPIRFRQAYPGRGADLEGRLKKDRVVLRGSGVTILESLLRFCP